MDFGRADLSVARDGVGGKLGSEELVLVHGEGYGSARSGDGRISGLVALLVAAVALIPGMRRRQARLRGTCRTTVGSATSPRD